MGEFKVSVQLNVDGVVDSSIVTNLGQYSTEKQVTCKYNAMDTTLHCYNVGQLVKKAYFICLKVYIKTPLVANQFSVAVKNFGKLVIKSLYTNRATNVYGEHPDSFLFSINYAAVNTLEVSSQTSTPLYDLGTTSPIHKIERGMAPSTAQSLGMGETLIVSYTDSAKVESTQDAVYNLLKYRDDSSVGIFPKDDEDQQLLFFMKIVGKSDRK